ncbi:MAG: FtsL-like putative cell division protein [Paludibacter sp.]
MSWFKKIAETIKGNEDFSDIKSSTLRDVINGNILTKKFLKKQYGLLILIAVLAFAYVDNRYYCETQQARVIELKKQIQDVKYESLTISAQLMRITRQSNILNMVNERGLNLKESNTPPVVIETPEENKEKSKK